MGPTNGMDELRLNLEADRFGAREEVHERDRPPRPGADARLDTWAAYRNRSGYVTPSATTAIGTASLKLDSDPRAAGVV